MLFKILIVCQQLGWTENKGEQNEFPFVLLYLKPSKIVSKQLF